MNTSSLINKNCEYAEMLEWFNTILCWKYDGLVDSSTIAHAYVWLTSTFGDFVASASCQSFSMF